MTTGGCGASASLARSCRDAACCVSARQYVDFAVSRRRTAAVPRYTRAMRRVLPLLLIAALSLPLVAGKKKGLTMRYNAGQKAELASVPLIVAKQRCENWAWAAVLEAMLRMQGAGAPLDQQYWIMRLHGGEICLPSAGNWQDMERFLARNYFVLDDGRKLRLEPQFRPGAPTSPDELVMAMRRGDPPMIVWRGHAYLLAGVSYDEQIAPNGARLIE